MAQFVRLRRFWGIWGICDDREITCYPGFRISNAQGRRHWRKGCRLGQYYYGERCWRRSGFRIEAGGSYGVASARQSVERVAAMLKKDIRAQKNELRAKMKCFRRDMPQAVKRKKDAAIRRGVQSLGQYQICQTLLTFVSTEIEVDTRVLIEQALRDGKRVAVPYCIEGTRQMDFYYIRSMADLVPRTFGVLEPCPNSAKNGLAPQTVSVLYRGWPLTGTVFALAMGRDITTVFCPAIPA